MDFEKYLKIMVDKEGSDLYLSTGTAASIKCHGELIPVDEEKLPPGRTMEIVDSILDDEQKEAFHHFPELNLVLSKTGIGRFRVNVFQQRGEVALVMRHIKSDIPSSASLKLPPVVNDLIMKKSGLLLFVGATGSGKSTSLAAAIDHRNRNARGHILTIEDPVEFLHRHQQSIVNQREVGIDTESYQDALKNALRQAPDVILIGEIRCRETMEHALNFSETGHLCLSTLHATNANQAIDRIINFFPDERHRQILLDLSLNLAGIVSQRLIPCKNNRRALATEVLLATPLAKDYISRGEISALKELMKKSENLQMHTFDSSLKQLYQEGRITLDNAIKYADSPNDLRLMISLEEGSNKNSMSDLSIQEVEEDQYKKPFN